MLKLLINDLLPKKLRPEGIQRMRRQLDAWNERQFISLTADPGAKRQDIGNFGNPPLRIKGGGELCQQTPCITIIDCDDLGAAGRQPGQFIEREFGQIVERTGKRERGIRHCIPECWPYSKRVTVPPAFRMRQLE